MKQIARLEDAEHMGDVGTVGNHELGFGAVRGGDVAPPARPEIVDKECSVIGIDHSAPFVSRDGSRCDFPASPKILSRRGESEKAEDGRQYASHGASYIMSAPEVFNGV